jgi:3-hydroxyisobutyrate dehydrogenase-like beta-hydroxyacid dehydrogenase
MLPKIGFIGMGIMGQAMAKNVLAAGYDLIVFNRTVEKTKPLADAGAQAVSTPAQVARWAEVIIVMVTGPEALDALVFEADGIATAEVSGKTLINMSTVSPMYSKFLSGELERRSVTFIDAPVSGSKKPAEEGSLIILAGGSREKITELNPLLSVMGKRVVYCGDAGQGSAMKMAVNLLLGTMMEGLCEAINFGKQCGLSVEAMLDAMLSGPLGCGLFALKGDMLRTDSFPAQFPLSHMSKDLRFLLQTADANGAAIPAGHTLFQLYRYAMGRRLGDLDFAAIKKVLEALNDSSPSPSEERL